MPETTSMFCKKEKTLAFRSTKLIDTLLEERVRPPKLVLSIIGDSSSFVPKPWLIPVLKTGLIATAKGAKDYLILYKGSNDRISSIVKKAIEDLWNLREDTKEGNLAEYKKANLKSIESFQTTLSNTTVFAKLHAQTLKIIAEKEIIFMKLAGNVDLIWRLPVLTVVAEGDLDTIDAIVQVLEIDLPILLLKGSGKAADFVAGFIEEKIINIVWNSISKGSKSQQTYSMITILDVNKETEPTNFTDSVTTSIIRGWSHILRNGESPERSEGVETEEAIIADRHDYVSVLLEEDDVQLGSNQVSDIYQKTLLQNGMDAVGLKKAVHTLKKAYKLKEVEEHLKRIELSDTSLTQAQQSDTMLDTETKDAINVILDKVVNSEPKTLKLWKGAPEPILKECKSLKTIVNEAGSTLTKCIQERSELMCYIQDRTSRMCIQSGRNICLSLLEYPKSMRIPSSEIKHMRIYEERSVYLQSKLYEENAVLTMELVVTEYSVWDITISPLECAHENMMLDFISHSCCQRRLNKIWYNDIGGSLKGVLKVRETNTLLKRSLMYRVKSYLYNFWNILDVTSYILTVTAILIRFFKPTTTNNLTRRFYSLSLFTMYMRFRHIILVERKLGPKIIMIKEMVKELLRFIGILLVFMVGVGVLYHANMYPKHEDMWNPAGWTYWRIWKIMYIPYWQIYGFNFLDSFDGNFILSHGI
ncbi:unnamed protein product [Mytilus edulis]|uniref:TRPM SLOG domain-containing protein n=1 Tax=Mytilus edulis TaxID=6550 RepID=A0A8S3R2F2_MYTED|nr:unnamed protein product [Mytilus edulis]